MKASEVTHEMIKAEFAAAIKKVERLEKLIEVIKKRSKDEKVGQYAQMTMTGCHRARTYLIDATEYFQLVEHPELIKRP